MTDTTNLEPGAAAIEKLVALGRRKFKEFLGDTNQSFADMVWNVGTLLRRFTATENIYLHFTYHSSLEKPLPEKYANVIKSWLLLSDASARSMEESLRAARKLWRTLEQRRGQTAVPFSWHTLCEEDIRQTELWMQERYAQATVYSSINTLLKLARFLDIRSICRPLFYSVQTPCPSKAICTVAMQEMRLSKLPSQRALEGLADVYRHLAQTPQDRLRIAAVAVLVVTGFRVSELLTLPVDCEVEEIRHGRTAYGLRYYKGKARSPGRGYDIRWLTPLQAELARQAIGEIKALTEPARQQARILEENDPHIPIPGFGPTDKMYARDIQQILGMPRSDAVHNSISRQELPRYGKEKKYYFNPSEFEAYLQQRRVKHLWTVARENGTYQMLSESLFVVFKNFFFPRGGHVCLLAEPMRKSHINSFLSSHGLNRSVFERCDIREADGTFCRMSSHQFRHWLNDIADKGGLPTDALTRWMGRDNPRDTEAYKHATMDERLRWVKEGIQAEQLHGTMADVYFELAEGERDVFLNGQIQAVHFTPMGLCLHDFAVEPCPYHLNCVRGCPDYLRTKGSQRERQHLLDVQRNTGQALASARQAAAQTGSEIAEAWVAHHEKTLQGIQRALSVDNDESLVTGDFVSPMSANGQIIEWSKQNGLQK
ncbi:MAG: hypothetical protein WAM60_18850 [Candidatus Promineifilaceae bacterium]